MDATTTSKASRRGQMHWRFWRFAAFAAVAALAFAAIGFGPAGAQSRGADYQRFDATLDVRPDGSFHVTEVLVVRFAGGPFTLGERYLPTARIETIDNVAVAEIDAAGRRHAFAPAPMGLGNAGADRYDWDIDGELFWIRWRFAPVSNATRTFVVEYDLEGALRVYPDATPPSQRIWWTPIGSDLTRDNSVAASLVTVRLPRPVALSDVTLATDGRVEAASAHSRDGRTFVWVHGPFRSGQPLEVRLQFPPVAAASPPSWQAADDARRLADERHTLIFAGLALATIFGGGVATYIAWDQRGRDPHADRVATFRTTPPDDLPPGAAGALLDERADTQDVIATLLDLARRGVLTIASRIGAPGAAEDFRLTLDQPPANASALDQAVLQAVFGKTPVTGDHVLLSDLGAAYRAGFPAISAALYGELVARGYFPRSPAATRDRWRKGALIALGAAAIGGGSLSLAFGGAAVALTIAVAGLAYINYLLANAMPRKTPRGAEAAEQWRAFRQYLDDIERYEAIDRQRKSFESYLPYATAFGLDQRWIRNFADVWPPTRSDAERLAWGRRGRPSGMRKFLRCWTGSAAPQGGVPAGWKDLQVTSDLALESIQAGSDSLATFLDVAVIALKVGGAFLGGGKGGSFGGGGGGFR